MTLQGYTIIYIYFMLHDIPNFFLIFFYILGYVVFLWVFSNCCKSPEFFPVYFQIIEKNPCIDEPRKFKTCVVQGLTVLL